MQRVATLKNLKYIIYFDLCIGDYMIPYVLFHSIDVFTMHYNGENTKNEEKLWNE